jgi:hypothetical protein
VSGGRLAVSGRQRGADQQASRNEGRRSHSDAPDRAFCLTSPVKALPSPKLRVCHRSRYTEISVRLDGLRATVELGFPTGVVLCSGRSGWQLPTWTLS